MARHPSRTTLASLASGVLTEARLRPTVGHLLVCERCRGLLGDKLESIAASGGPDDGKAVDRAIRHALTVARKTASDAEFEDPQAAAREIVATRRAGKASLAAARALVELAASFRHASPKRTLELTEFAATFVRRPDLDRFGRGPANDLRALAWAEHANALRINDQLPKAREVMDDAFGFALEGSGDILLRARLLDLMASLDADSRQLGRADSLLKEVCSIYRRLRDDHLEGRALIARGNYAGLRNEPEQALRLLGKGLALIDQEKEPGLTLAARHGITWWTVELGRYREARRLLFASRHLYAADRNEMNQLRLRWLEGKIAAGLDEFTKAEELLGDVRRGFGELDLPYKKALVTLDLMAVLLRQGRTRRVFEVIDETVKTFQRLEIHREALAGLIILHEAAEREALNLGCLDAIATILKRFEHLPGHR